MNYRNNELISALAAEYVLGTLNGPARKRFQTLLMTSRAAREATWMWEQHLNGLGEGLPAVAPAAKVWQGIQRKLGFLAPVVPLKVQRRISRLTASALLASAAAVLLAVLLIRTPVPSVTVEPTQQLAVFQTEDNLVLWVVEIEAQRIRVQATDNLIAPVGKDYELWMVTSDGEPPVSLGLLPKNGELALTKPPQWDSWPIAALAVSLEPTGGSPTGAPTEVVHIANLASA